MKKIINGIRYDTGKARLIGEAHSLGIGENDFQWWEAALYVSPRSGRYFLTGKGGAMSRFAQSAGQNTWSGGEDLIPMSQEQALEWAEKYLVDVNIIDQHFSDIIEVDHYR